MITNCSDGPYFCYKCADTREELESTLNKSDFVIVGKTAFTYGIKTDFEGRWCRPLLYVGQKGTELYFYIGSENGKHYYEYFHYIDTNRIAINTYKGQGARDFNFINGVWDWQVKSHTKRKERV